MAATQQSSPPPNLFNIVEHNHNRLKHKSKHGEQGDEEKQEVFDYSHHDDEPPETSCGSSRASLSSSPSHEFSFTVCSLYTSPPPSSTTLSSANTNVLKDSFTNTSSSTTSSAVATAIDLSPADEIFFHGHLLPLHLLSGGHLSMISPRSSTNSLDSFTLPITSNFSNPNNNDSSMDQAVQDRALDSMEKPKSRSFSLFRNRTTTIKSGKSPENQETEENRSSKPHHDNNEHHKNLNKVKFELTNAIKLVRSLLIFKQGNNSNNNNSSGRKGGIQMRGVHQTFSYSGNLSSPRRSNKQGAEVLRGRFSAPASTRTSPTNSGMFLEGGSRNNSSSSSCNSDSTMEELQAAIQAVAAIAHCKNSSIAAAAAAVQDKI